jgi:hypothetical protein
MLRIAFFVPCFQKAACKGHKMQVKKEVPVEVVHISRFFLPGAVQPLGRFRRQLPGHIGSHWDDTQP